MRSEIEYHLKRAEEKLKAAEHLHKGGFYNDTASRAYYSMYHAAAGLLLTKDFYPRSHKGLISKFGLEFVKQDIIDKWYAEALSDEKDMREIGDYEVTKDVTKEESGELIENAKLFLAKIKEVIKEIGVKKRTSKSERRDSKLEKKLEEKGK